MNKVKEKPMLFNAEMVRAVLDGRKWHQFPGGNNA